MARYLPPFEIVRGMLNLTTVRGKTRVDMTFEEAQRLIRTLLSAIEVDEAYYLARNTDVADGIRNGKIRSAQQHFIDHGYFEGRLPYQIDVNETFYLARNPDVAETVGQGLYRTAQEHFDGPGYSEGRAPYELTRKPTDPLA